MTFCKQFYSGASPALPKSPIYHTHPHEHHCNELLRVKSEHCGSSEELYAFDQVVLDHTAHEDNVETFLGELHENNCGHISAEAVPSLESDHRHALLQFMLAATPNSAVIQDIQQNFDKKAAGMSTHYEPHLVGDHSTMVAIVHDVPDTVNPVKVKQVYIQVLGDGTTELHPAWQVSTPTFI